MAQLYQTFNCDLPTSDLKKSEKMLLIHAIDGMDQIRHELVFTLIYEHYVRTLPNGAEKELTPYGCQCEKGNLTFNLSKIPIPLRHILYRFINMTKT